MVQTVLWETTQWLRQSSRRQTLSQDLERGPVEGAVELVGLVHC